MTLVKVDGAKPMTLVSWKIKTGGIDQAIDMLLVLSSPTNQLEKCIALNDVEGVTNQLDAGWWLLEDQTPGMAELCGEAKRLKDKFLSI